MAGRGPKPLSNDEKALRGTIKPSRNNVTIELPPAEGTPQKPTWLTEEGDAIWMDSIEHVVRMRTVGAIDADAFGTYCNLAGRIATVWREGGMPPVNYLSEMRKMSENFGAFGAKSRTMKLPAAAETKTLIASAFAPPQLTKR